MNITAIPEYTGIFILRKVYKLTNLMLKGESVHPKGIEKVRTTTKKV